jgi:pyrroline-5-carboxylate reductase
MNITFIGGGNMAKALIGGLIQEGFSPNQLKVVQTNAEKADKLRQEFSISVFSSLDASAAASEIIILAVKPQQIAQAAKQLAPFLKQQLIISVAAGIRLADLSRWLNNYQLLVRAMPNTPALVRSGITGLFALPSVNTSLKEKTGKILTAVGNIIWLENEEQLDYITALSGSGPAYVFYFMQALEEAALEFNFNKAQARQLALDTFNGAAKLAMESTEDVVTLRQRVTSKGGTTERAVQTMETAAVKNNIIEAIRAAAKRAQELGNELGKQN